MLLIIRCILICLLAGACIPPASAATPPADSAADYVAERIRYRMDGVHGQMMTDDFVFDYFEDVFTAVPTCVIRMPRLYGSEPGMPHAIDVPGMSGFLIGDDSMLMVVLAPQAVRLWIPDPDGEGPGIRLMASSTRQIHAIGSENWTELDDEPGYLLTDSDMTLNILDALYTADSVHANPNNSPIELQSYDTRGYFTAMNTARRLCPDNLPRQLLRRDPNPRAGERVFNALEPAENDQIIDLAGKKFPIDSPSGTLDVSSNLEKHTQTLTLNGRSMEIENSMVRPHAIISLSGNSFALISHWCTRCGNAYDPGNSLELVRLDEAYRNKRYPLDQAYISSGSLAGMSLSLEDGLVTIVIPHVGTYRIEHENRELSIHYEAAPIHIEKAALEQERKTLSARIVDENADRPPLRMNVKDDQTALSLSGVLHGHAFPHRSVYRPDERTSAYTLELDPPVHLLGPCASSTTLFHLEIVSNDEELAEKAGQHVSVWTTLRCDRWNDLVTRLDDVAVEAPASATAIQAVSASATDSGSLSPTDSNNLSPTESESLLPNENAVSAFHGSVDGTWHCNTHNPDGTESSDRYYFNDDGSFVSVSEGMRVSGQFERSGRDLQLTFTRIIAQGKGRAVNARTSARIQRLDDQHLEFTSVDATTSAIRRVSCRG
ncbi:MAG: hypothetical protein HKN43_07645 [Rhodothermales bacterium]|nr:hypothetical protein [Rhodothermales bacterium]